MWKISGRRFRMDRASTLGRMAAISRSRDGLGCERMHALSSHIAGSLRQLNNDGSRPRGQTIENWGSNGVKRSLGNIIHRGFVGESYYGGPLPVKCWKTDDNSDSTCSRMPSRTIPGLHPFRLRFIVLQVKLLT